MAGQIPENPKIYHIVHLDRLASIIEQGCLWCDARVPSKHLGGTMIGIPNIKQRRLSNNLKSQPGLTVAQCVPFYFCPRSIMLYVISQKNHPCLSYRGGQENIIHLQADLNTAVQWAQSNNKRWAFTDANAATCYFNDYCSQEALSEICWDAVNADVWKKCKEQKQAEFLLEEHFPWTLVEAIGVYSEMQFQQVDGTLNLTTHQPRVSIQKEWYY